MSHNHWEGPKWPSAGHSLFTAIGVKIINTLLFVNTAAAAAVDVDVNNDDTLVIVIIGVVK